MRWATDASNGGIGASTRLARISSSDAAMGSGSTSNRMRSVWRTVRGEMAEQLGGEPFRGRLRDPVADPLEHDEAVGARDVRSVAYAPSGPMAGSWSDHTNSVGRSTSGKSDGPCRAASPARAVAHRPGTSRGTPRIPSGVPSDLEVLLDRDSGRPANSNRITWPSLARNNSSIWPRGHADDLAHVARALVLAVGPSSLLDSVGVRERGGVGHRRDRERLDPVRRGSRRGSTPHRRPASWPTTSKRSNPSASATPSTSPASLSIVNAATSSTRAPGE